jgi:hypothetical protein
MLIDRFDQISRALFSGQTRRGVLSLGTVSLLAVLGKTDTDAKKRKHRKKKKCQKPCGPCRKCQKGKCKPRPAGTPCGEGQQCFANGACVACDVCSNGCAPASLQDAINAAADGATIQICPGTYPTTASIVAKDLTIIGAGAGANGTILDGQGLGSVLHIEDAMVKVLGLSVRGGAAGVGAGINSVQATVTLEDMHIAGNHATSRGGGIHSIQSQMTLISCQLTGNSAPNGGGIANVLSTVTLRAGSIVTGNTATDSGGAGGILNDSGGLVEIFDGSLVTDNTPVDCTGTTAC